MNPNDTKNNKDPNEQDPFDFFKLSPEPSGDNKNTKKAEIFTMDDHSRCFCYFIGC